MGNPPLPDIIRAAGVLASLNPRRPVLVGRRPIREARGGGALAFSFFLYATTNTCLQSRVKSYKVSRTVGYKGVENPFASNQQSAFSKNKKQIAEG